LEQNTEHSNVSQYKHTLLKCKADDGLHIAGKTSTIRRISHNFVAEKEHIWSKLIN